MRERARAVVVIGIIVPVLVGIGLEHGHHAPHGVVVSPPAVTRPDDGPHAPETILDLLNEKTLPSATRHATATLTNANVPSDVRIADRESAAARTKSFAESLVVLCAAGFLLWLAQRREPCTADRLGRYLSVASVTAA